MDEQPRSTASWIIEFAGVHKALYAASVALALAEALCSFIPYLITADIINALIARNADWPWYAVRLAYMACAWAVRQLLHAFSTTLSHKATFHVLGVMRKRACDKLARRPLGDVLDVSSGSLKNILVERIDATEPTLAHIVPEVSSNLALALVIIVYIFVVDWRLGLAALAMLIPGMVCFSLMMKDNDAYQSRCLEAAKNLNGTAVEYIEGIEVIKVFGKTQGAYERFSRTAEENANSFIEWMRASIIPFTFAQVLMPASVAVVAPVGAALVMTGSLDVPSYVIAMIASLGAIAPIFACMSYTDDLRVIDLVVRDIVSILDAREQPRPEVSRALPADASVTLQDVRFGYHDKEVLHGVSLDVPSGSFCALVGPSGSGKSTIARLIAGLWDADEGAVRIGGVDVSDLSTEDFNRRVAYVSQGSFLFNQSVRENIRMGNPKATDADVERAARAAGCHDFIMRMDAGYDTPVGSSGSHLSGGERQRISIARALLKDAPIVILDEATAYMDPENEALVQESVSRLVDGKTLIVIAHRLSTVRDADQICVIDNGRVAERGTHDDLVARGGLYARLWDAHVRGRDEAPALEGKGETR